MRVTKVAYCKNWIRRVRKCQSCQTQYTTRERFDGAQLEPGGVVVPEAWPVADNEVASRIGAALRADARRALNDVVRSCYARSPVRSSDGSGCDAGSEVTEAQ